jgi:hypothetical protein
MGNVALIVEIPSESMAALRKRATKNVISLDELVIQFSNTIYADYDNDEVDDDEESCPELDEYNVAYDLEEVLRREKSADEGPIYKNMMEVRKALGV